MLYGSSLIHSFYVTKPFLRSALPDTAWLLSQDIDGLVEYKKPEELGPTCLLLSGQQRRPHIGEYLVQIKSYIATVAVRTLTERSPELLCPLVYEEPLPSMVSKVGSTDTTVKSTPHSGGRHWCLKCRKKKLFFPGQSKE